MNNRDKSALALALAIVGGIAAGLRCDASEWVENSSQTNPRVAAYTVKTYTEGSDPFDAFSLWEQYWYSSRHGAEATVLYFSDKLFVDLIMYLEDGATGDVGTDTLERVYDGELKSLQSEVESEEMEW